MKKVSRFAAAQPKGTYGNVAPPSYRGPPGSAAHTLAAQPPSTVRIKDYFDDDEDDLVNPTSGTFATKAVDDDDYDPLDDFM